MKIFRFFLAVLCYILWPFFAYLLRPFFSKRVLFERKNEGLNSFSNSADFAFEVSSEGELEQIQFLLEELLQKGFLVELIYCSDSAEENVSSLARRYPHNLKIFRLPLITVCPWSKQSALSFLTAPVLVLCRYDFFPELLLYGLKRAERFILLNASLRGKKGRVKLYLHRFLFSLFCEIIPVSALERERFKQLLGRSIHPEVDLRVLRIEHRLQRTPKTIKEWGMGRYRHFIEQWPRENRLLLGQFYARELDILKDSRLLDQIREKKILVAICLHLLNEKEKRTVIEKLGKKFSLPLQIINLKSITEKELSPFHLLDMKGVLCELYQFFPICYVGGGFGTSIHSVLEPYLAGTSIICGPRVQRSSEFELIRHLDAGVVQVIDNQRDFFPSYLEMKKQKILVRNRQLVDIMKQNYQKLEENLLHGTS